MLREAIAMFDGVVKKTDKKAEISVITMSVTLSNESWEYDNLEEFLSGYRNAIDASFSKYMRGSQSVFRMSYLSSDNLSTTVTVDAPTREQIEAVFEIFEKHFPHCQLPESVEDESDKTPTIFVGHGHSPQWRDLKDHLQEQHGYSVQTYETGARAGHTIRDIIQKLASTSTFAILVLTCDDIVDGERHRARQNVVHEAGLFQGRLGFHRAIVLLEDGVEEFSNMDGIHHIKFSKGNIKETFGDVLATIRREFEM